MEKFRSRTFALLLYPQEDITHREALSKIEKSYDYAHITHDKDFDDDGVIKKSHVHVVLRFENQVWNTKLAKDLGITENYIENVRQFDNALLYLVHANDPDKFQYDFSSVCGTLKTRLKEKLNSVNKSEGEKMIELIDYIESYNGFLSVTEFSRYCASNGYWAEFRRSGSILLKVIEEHNHYFKK